MPAIVPIPPRDDYWEQVLFTRMIVHQAAADPTTAEVPLNQWVIYKNTTSGTVKLWVNDNGTLKSVTIA